MAETIEIPPLLERCQKCDGCGVVYSEAWRAFNQKYPDADRWKYAINRGEQPQEPEEHECRACDGHGKVPTEAGKQIAELIRIVVSQ